MRAYRYVLTLLIVLTVIAIAIAVAWFAWTELDLGASLESFINSAVFGVDENPRLKPKSNAEITVDMQKSDKASEKATVLFADYFTMWYASLCSGESESISSLYAYQTEEYLTDKLCLDYLSALRNASPALTCDSAKISLLFTAFGKDDFGKDEYTLTVTAVLSSNSKTVWAESREHVFSVRESGKRAEITAHDCSSPENDYTLGALGDVIAADGWTRSDLSYTYLEKYMDAALENALERRTAATEKIKAGLLSDDIPVELPEVEFSYLREKAVGYARKYIGTPNETFGSYPDNAANFASQCVFAGDIPMDMQGEAALQWKWYSKNVNTRREHLGCSVSWYEPQPLYDYFQSNTGFGVSAVCDAPLSSLEAGDLLFLYSGDSISDVLVITEGVCDEAGAPVDFAVADDFEVMLGGLSFDDVKGVKILGYNTVNPID